MVRNLKQALTKIYCIWFQCSCAKLIKMSLLERRISEWKSIYYLDDHISTYYSTLGPILCHLHLSAWLDFGLDSICRLQDSGR